MRDADDNQARVASEAMPEPPPPRVRERLRDLPSVDRLATSVARAELADRRAEVLAGDTADVDLVARARARLKPSLRRVLNATGVVLHTNLGRAPLAASARARASRPRPRATRTSSSTSPAARAARATRTSRRCCASSPAPRPALAVNNGAAALLLALAALAGRPRGGRLARPAGRDRRRLPHPRGRRPGRARGWSRSAPPIARALADYDARARRSAPARSCACTRRTSARRLHRARSTIDELVARARACRVVDDVGSGALVDDAELRRRAGGAPLGRAPARPSSASRATSCSGGPQAGLMVGTRRRSRACRRHPLARALRIDKLSLAALEATLALYRDPERARAELPVLRHARGRPPRLRARAERAGRPHRRRAWSPRSRSVGGGALPLVELPGPAVAIDVAAGSRRLRAGDPPLRGRGSPTGARARLCARSPTTRPSRRPRVVRAAREA